MFSRCSSPPPSNPLRTLMTLREANLSLRREVGELEDGSSVSCMPFGLCREIYGTKPQHFEDFGFVSPNQHHCLYGYGSKGGD